MQSDNEFIRELREQVKGEVKFDALSRAIYNTDASIYQIEPLGVVIPRDAEDVANTVMLANQHHVSVLPRGGGTSLAGQTVNHSVVLDFSKYMNSVLEVNSEETSAWVEPGLVLDVLNQRVGSFNLKYAPDPTTSNRATIGGGIGNNTCGSHSIIYGKTLDHVLELEVVLADGSITNFELLTPDQVTKKKLYPGLEGNIYRQSTAIAETHRKEIEANYPKILRRVSGYNLDELLNENLNLTRVVVGSEGTLVTVTKAKVNLVPKPKHTGLLVLHFKTLIEAMEATVSLLDVNPSAIELVDGNIVRAAKSQLALSRQTGFVEGDPEALLIVEVQGDSLAEIESSLETAARKVQHKRLGYAIVKLIDPMLQADVWTIRRAGLGLLMGVKGDAKPLPFVEDTAVAPEDLPKYVQRFDEIVVRHGTTAAYYGHASVGCIHIRPLINLKTDEGLERMVQIAEEVSDLVLEFGGSLSGEHGDGIVRGVWNEKMFGSRIYQGFRDLKQAFDPLGIMNPGKIVDCPPMTDNLRIGPTYQTQNFATKLDFSKDFGFAGSVELCNGQGACRKTIGGTMCPSYMVTRDEEHSTRGRANALRAVLSGTLPMKEFTGTRLHEALDLCLECKACKAECPSNVDMAKLKYEFLAHYNEANGVSLRSRAFASIGIMNRFGCKLAPVSNWLMDSKIGRLMLNHLGIHPFRKLPKFANPTFSTWFKGRPSGLIKGVKGSVVLFHDTFTEGNYPSVGKAATQLLERAGFEVILVPKACCGRPMISKGFLDKARRSAQYNVDVLFPYVSKGMKVIGTEPSCLLTLRDEYPDLLPNDDRVKSIASSSLLLDEFLLSVAASEDQEFPALKFAPYEGKVLLQCHCHQKALVGVQASVKLLQKIPGIEVDAIDAGCCGMAGAFGFEKEHYDLSMQIGERELFPTIRANPDCKVLITGVSCRQQLEPISNSGPMHIAEFLAEQLASE